MAAKEIPKNLEKKKQKSRKISNVLEENQKRKNKITSQNILTTTSDHLSDSSILSHRSHDVEEIVLCMDFVLSGCVSCCRLCSQMASQSEDLERQKPRMLSQPLVTRTQGGLTGRKDLLQQSQGCTTQCARSAVDTGSTNSFCL